MTSSSVLFIPQNCSSTCRASGFHSLGDDILENVRNSKEERIREQLMAVAQELSVAFHKDSGELVFAGGLQQYLIREAKNQQQNISQPKLCDGSSPMLTFHDLPDSLQLEIFTYLSAVELCRVASVCKHWLMLSSDELLWQEKLEADLPHWHVISQKSHPDLLQQQHADWPTKELYLRCSPEIIELMHQEHNNFNNLSSILRSFLPKKTPKLALLGPGLESSTSGLVVKIIEHETDLFKPVGMFPGNAGGVGSGFTIKMSNSLMFHLSTLYASNKRDRENWQEGERLQHHRLLQQVAHDAIYELKDNVKDFCKSLDGFVFMLDATKSNSVVEESQGELAAMLQAVADRPNVPVLVLSCIPDSTCHRLPCVEVVKCLQLSTLNRPWQVHDCIVEDFTGIQEGFEWIIELCNRR